MTVVALVFWSPPPRKPSPKFTVRWQSPVSVPTRLKVAATRWLRAPRVIAFATAGRLCQSQFPGQTVGPGRGPGSRASIRRAPCLWGRGGLQWGRPEFSTPQREAPGSGEKARSLPPAASLRLGHSSSRPMPRAPPLRLPVP